MVVSLEKLKQQQLVWRATDASTSQSADYISTGFTELDQHLNGGWPLHGVVEIRAQCSDIGELRLILPTLIRLATEPGIQAWIAPPLKLNAQPLCRAGIPGEQVLVVHPRQIRERYWACEQCLRSGCCRAVILFTQELNSTQAKRLQLAAKQGECLLFVIRYPQQKSREESLPISLRMTLGPSLPPCPEGLKIHITKQQRGWAPEPFYLKLDPVAGLTSRQSRQAESVHVLPTAIAGKST